MGVEGVADVVRRIVERRVVFYHVEIRRGLLVERLGSLSGEPPLEVRLVLEVDVAADVKTENEGLDQIRERTYIAPALGGLFGPAHDSL